MMNFTTMIAVYSNNSWWANWLLQSQKNLSAAMTEGRYIDPVGRVLLLYDRAAAFDLKRETLVLEEVPSGINIFALLNLRVPPNTTNLEEWKVIFSQNSSSYSNISSILEVSQYKTTNDFFAMHYVISLGY